MSASEAVRAELELRIERAGGLWHVAETHGYDRRNLSKYTTGQTTPSVPKLLELLQMMEIDVPEFFEAVVRREQE